MSRIQLRDLRKVYPTGVVAVDGIDLSVDDGEVVVLLGPTGCGKSTVLRMIAGLETPTAGEVLFDGVPSDQVPVRERGVAMVFQDYALYPHLTVAENIGFPLIAVEQAQRTARVTETARLLGLQALLHRRPAQLSGGQRQRVAMARAIVRTPRAFLLDQPLSSLDASSRDAVRGDIAEFIHTLGIATVYVTHDHVEALCLADRVAVMRRGRIEQIGTPEEIYADPACLFVAAFVGSPRMNLVQAAVYAEPEDRVVIDLGSQTLELPWTDPRASALAEYHTARVTVGLRPGAFTPSPDVQSALRGVVRMIEMRGHEALVHLETGCAPTPHLQSHLELPDARGELAQIAAVGPADEPVRTRLVRQRLARLVPRRTPEEPMRYAIHPTYNPDHDLTRHTLGDLAVRVGAAALPQLGETLALTVDIDQLYLFDGAGAQIGSPTPGQRYASLRDTLRSSEEGTMRYLWIVVGVIAVLAGVVWTLQGLNVLGGTGMSGNSTWAIVGPIVAVVGMLVVLFGIRRRDT